METRLTLAPGQNGTKKLVARYGDRLLRVRYRYDAERKLRLKTIELIIEAVPWTPRERRRRRAPGDLVAVRIEFGETDLRARVKEAGGKWLPGRRLWELEWRSVRELGLEGRVVEAGEG